MTGKTGTFVALAVALALLFVRLGKWQIDRLAERRSINSAIGAKLAASPVPFERIQGGRAYRRVSISGIPDYENEIVLAGRSRNGSPGVHVLTPVRSAGGDTAVLVNRGWVYAADAATVDLGRFREARDSFHGFVVAMAEGVSPGPAGGERKLRALTRAGTQRMLPYPVAGEYIVARDSAGAEAPVRLPPLALDDGPHLSYAIQWFCFALIALGGAGAVAYRTYKSGGGGSTAA